MFKFSPVDRTITIYHLDENNSEYVSESTVTIPANTGIPANSTDAKPPAEVKGKARVYIDGAWKQEIDSRGTLVWRKNDGVSCIMGTLGKIPDDYTDIKPPDSPFFSWDGSKWTQDESKLKEYYVNIAKSKIEEGVLYVKDRMEVLKYGEDIGQLTDKETKEYSDLKLFRLTLSRIDVSTAPDIEWPVLEYVY